MNTDKLDQFMFLQSESNLGLEDSSLLERYDVSTCSHRQFKD
jgi:hypothetical protein